MIASSKRIRPFAKALLQSSVRLVALAGLLGSAYATSAVTLTEADAGVPREVGIGATVEIRLRAQLGTGYSWSLEAPNELGFHPVKAPSVSGGTLPGGWQDQIFTFSASEPGHYRISFAYRQPWTDSKTAQRRIYFDIIVPMPR
jgi:predicted secreted protein